MTLNLHLSFKPDNANLDRLRAATPDDVVVTAGDDIPTETHVLVSGRPTRAQLDELPDLRVLLIPFVGLPATTREIMVDYPHIAVYNVHHNAPMTAEMALALLFSAARSIVPADKVFRTGDWTPRYEGTPILILEGKTALILGYGQIGRRVGAALKAVGMRVVGVRRRVSSAGSDDSVYPPHYLPDLLKQAQVLICTLPGTPQTEGMIGAEQIALLPPGAVIVNVGRANVIDQHALYEGLKSGHLGAAGLDVWYTYPPDADSRTHTFPADVPLWELDNVVMSPHRSGAFNTVEGENRRMDAIAESINMYLREGVMPSAVDIEAGY